MSFDALPPRSHRIAIVGGGISGLAAAHRLAPQHKVTLFEAEARLGGHARTVTAGLNGNQPVDTGFIVFNYANYPHLTRMFDELDVPVTKSDMSFGASVDDGQVEYGLGSLNSLAAQRRNLVRPGFYRMVRDIFKFNANAEKWCAENDGSIGELMDDLRLGPWFQDYYLTPFSGAIWSTPPSEIRNFPADAMVRFFRNHALLDTYGQHQWWTVDGGSIEYIKRLTQSLSGRGVTFNTGHPVEGVVRSDAGVTIHAQGLEVSQYDHVIMACHADQALRLFTRPTTQETATLGAMRFQDNQMILHRDAAQMPRRKEVWSSWVYKSDSTREETAIGVTYWMNLLQNIPHDDPHFISLNPAKEVRQELIYDQKVFRHPVFDSPAIKAQASLRTMQGDNNTWFAGAYTRNGFHEDGFASAVRISRAMGAMAAV